MIRNDIFIVTVGLVNGFFENSLLDHGRSLLLLREIAFEKWSDFLRLLFCLKNILIFDQSMKNDGISNSIITKPYTSILKNSLI